MSTTYANTRMYTCTVKVRMSSTYQNAVLMYLCYCIVNKGPCDTNDVIKVNCS